MGFSIKQMLDKATEFVPFPDMDIYIRSVVLKGEKRWVVETEIGERITASLEETPNSPGMRSRNTDLTTFTSVEKAFAVAEAYRNSKLEG